jgi:hypothetical protein
MVKLQANDPVALAVASLMSSRKASDAAERDFGAFAYHLWHVVTDVERMGEGFVIGPDWMLHDKDKGREAVVSRCMQVMFPVGEGSKDKNAKAMLRAEQQKNRGDVKSAVEMLAGMARMGEMFSTDGAQWDGTQWLVPASWFIKEGELDRVFLSGQRGKLHKGEHVPLVSKNASHTCRVQKVNKAGDDTEAFVTIRPNRSSIAALGKPAQERVQSQEPKEGTPVVQAVNLLSKLLDQAAETGQQGFTGDAADAFGDVVARIVRNDTLWLLALAERDAFIKEQEAAKAAA